MAAAGELDCPVRIHMAQGKVELDVMDHLHGATGPQWLARHGMLNDRLIAPHGTYATDVDVALDAEHGVSLAHSPLVSARMGSVLKSFASFRRARVNIGMATDTAPSRTTLIRLLSKQEMGGPQGPPISLDWYQPIPAGRG